MPTFTGLDPKVLIGPPGPPGGASYTHIQDDPQEVWTIVHNLQRHPPVVVVNSAGDQVYGSVHYVDNNTVQVTFSGAFSGKAYC